MPVLSHASWLDAGIRDLEQELRAAVAERDAARRACADVFGGDMTDPRGVRYRRALSEVAALSSNIREAREARTQLAPGQRRSVHRPGGTPTMTDFMTEVRSHRDRLTVDRSSRVAELEAIVAAPEADGRPDLTDGETARFDAVRSEIEDLDAEIAKADKRLADLKQVQARRDAARTAPSGSPFGYGYSGGVGPHGKIDEAFRSGLIPDHAAERATELLASNDQRTRTEAEAWVETAGDPAYLSAFAKTILDPVRGHMLWDNEERVAFAKVHRLNAAEGRAVSSNSLTLPLALDPAIRLTSAGSINPLRKLATVHTTTSDSWNGLSSAGVTAEWKAEHAEMADASPTIAPKKIPVNLGDAFIPFSFEVGMDARDFVEQITKLLVDAADQLQATAFTTGTGINDQPTGVITALLAGGAPSVVAPTTPETFTPADDVYKVQNALPPRFQPRAAWCAALGTINTLAQVETANGSKEFPDLMGDRLLRRPVHELSNMRSSTDINPAATAANPILLYGDFAEGFAIVDRIGTQLEIIPHLFGANRRPTAERGAVMWFRTGSDVVIQNAFRLLNIPTTA